MIAVFSSVPLRYRVLLRWSDLLPSSSWLLKESWFALSDESRAPSLKRLPSSPEADDTPAKGPLTYLTR
jgi:hypothetical protein